VAAPPAYANVELSRGAFVIRTSAEQGALMKTQIDSKSLIKTFFSNRKAVSESLGRIQKSVQQELKEPVWLELQKEIMDIEGDVAPTIQFTPPVDIQQAVKDFSQGKINFLLNGEIFNIAVEPSFSEKEDDLVIKVKGFKGELLPYQIAAREAQAEARKGPIETQLAKYEAFWEFWNQPYPSQVSDEPSNESVMMKKSVVGSELTYPLIFSTLHAVFAPGYESHQRWHSHNGCCRVDLVGLRGGVRVLHQGTGCRNGRCRSQAPSRCGKEGPQEKIRKRSEKQGCRDTTAQRNR
jgi:hypothetical protein